MLVVDLQQALIEKIRHLPPNKVLAVSNFVDAILDQSFQECQPEEPLLSAAGILSGEPINPEEIDSIVLS